MKITELKSIYFEAWNGWTIVGGGYVVCKTSIAWMTDQMQPIHIIQIQTWQAMRKLSADKQTHTQANTECHPTDGSLDEARLLQLLDRLIGGGASISNWVPSGKSPVKNSKIYIFWFLIGFGNARKREDFTRTLILSICHGRNSAIVRWKWWTW